MFKTFIAAACLALGLASPSFAATSLAGAKLSASGGDPSLSAFSSRVFTVGAGVETYAFSSIVRLEFFSFDFSESGLLTVGFTTPGLGATYSGSPFVFTDSLGTIADFTGFDLISSTNVGITQGDLTFTDDTLSFNFGGAMLTDGPLFTAQIHTAMAAIPLPASLPILLAGLGGLALLRRRKG